LLGAEVHRALRAPHQHPKVTREISGPPILNSKSLDAFELTHIVTDQRRLM
jgi:hypothetical protein